jgi:glycosyltransferase involved in cell wall biosynthesis
MSPEGRGRRPLRIILVMIEPPVPFGNAAARWYYVLLRGLVARGHRVTAFVASSKPAEVEEASRLFPAPAYDVRSYQVATGGGLRSKLRSIRRPYSYLFTDAFRRDLDAELTRGFDVLHLEHTWGGWLGLDHVAQSLLHVHYLFRIDLAGPVGPGLMNRLRYAASLDAEARLLRSYRTISTLSPRLSAAVAAINPSARVATVPLGLDASLYPFDPGPPPPRPPTVGLIGSFNWQPSYSAAERLLTRLWPEISRQVPGARLQVVGRAARSALSALAGARGVELAEDVPDTVPYFQATDVLLYAPPRGSGMKVKILEAFALGTPVVTNAEGVEGLPATDGVHAGIAEDDDGLIERTVGLLRDADARHARRLAARRLLEEHCGPGPTVDAMEDVHARIAGLGG